MHIYICEKFLTKTQYLNLALASQAHFVEWCLRRFGKELFIIQKHTNTKPEQFKVKNPFKRIRNDCITYA